MQGPGEFSLMGQILNHERIIKPPRHGVEELTHLNKRHLSSYSSLQNLLKYFLLGKLFLVALYTLGSSHHPVEYFLGLMWSLKTELVLFLGVSSRRPPAVAAWASGNAHSLSESSSRGSTGFHTESYLQVASRLECDNSQQTLHMGFLSQIWEASVRRHCEVNNQSRSWGRSFLTATGPVYQPRWKKSGKPYGFEEKEEFDF